MQPDDLDKMLQGDDQPADPLSENNDQGDGSENTQTPTPEEVEFNNLSGSTQERIRKLARDKRELTEKLQSFQQNQTGFVPPAPGSNFRDPNEELAIRTLEQKGIATKDGVNQIVGDKFNEIRWEMEQNRLETKYSGNSNEPQYVREEVEAFIQEHPQYRTYAPEDVFKYKMFPDEFTNIEVQRRGTGKTGGRGQNLRPTKSPNPQEAMTPEYIEQRLQQPDGRQWYDDNLEKINAVLSKMGQQ